MRTLKNRWPRHNSSCDVSDVGNPAICILFCSLFWVFLSLLLTASQNTIAQDDECVGSISVGKIEAAQNHVLLVHGNNREIEISRDSPNALRIVCGNTEIRVGENSKASVSLHGINSVLKLNENTVLNINLPTFQPRESALHNSPSNEISSVPVPVPVPVPVSGALQYCSDTVSRAWLNLKSGAIRLFTTDPQKLIVVTPYVNAAIEGTEFSISVIEGTARVDVVDGLVNVCNDEGNISLQASQSAEATSGRAPKLVNSDNSVQWDIYFPPVTSQLFSSEVIQEAYSILLTGDTKEAVRILSSINSAKAYSLRSLIETTLNNRELALELANRAIEENDQLAEAWLAMSYVRQSLFELDSALAAAEAASELSQNNAVLLARLSELQLIAGEPERAAKTARKAVRSNPEFSRPHAILGFLKLNAYETEESLVYFATAIEKNEFDPLPYVGQGMAYVQRKQLQKARERLETAVSLDPTRALLRTYLGRIYFEMDLVDQSKEQYLLAQKYDIGDPTPNLYMAILQQSVNNPVNALSQINRSIKKNNRRAIYRTKDSLIADASVRGARLAKIYKDLGFDRLAINVGSAAVNLDPLNVSGHEFLAEAYLGKPRHEAARASEIYQSQLLQPNHNRPPPALSVQSDLINPLGSDEFSIGLREYTSFFHDSGPVLDVSLFRGNRNTLGSEFSASIVQHNTSFGVGHYNLKTTLPESFEASRQEAKNIYLSRSINKNISFRIDANQRNTENTVVSPIEDDQSSETDKNDKYYNLGVRLSISKKSNIFLSYLYSDFKLISDDRFGGESFGLNESSLAHDYQLRYSYSGDVFNIASGVSYYHQILKAIDTEQYEPECNPTPCTFSRGNILNQQDFYFYSYFSGYGNTNWTAGASYSDFNIKEIHSTQEISPKLGVEWALSDQISLRGVYIEGVKRTLVANRSIAPTQVAGFNQLYDDGNGSRHQKMGVAVDVSLSKDIYTGLEFNKRRIRPLTTVNNGTDVEESKHEEVLVDAYFYWAFTSQWAVSLNPNYTRFDIIKTTNPFLPRGVTTKSLPIKFRYTLNIENPQLHAYLQWLNGVKMELGVNYIEQERSERFDTITSSYQTILSAKIGYRFKNRKGDVSLTVNNLTNEEVDLFSELQFSQLPRDLVFTNKLSALARMNIYF